MATDIIGRLESGEQNPWLVYELCKRWRPESLFDLAYRLQGVDRDVVAEGYDEWMRAYKQGTGPSEGDVERVRL